MATVLARGLRARAYGNVPAGCMHPHRSVK